MCVYWQWSERLTEAGQNLKGLVSGGLVYANNIGSAEKWTSFQDMQQYIRKMIWSTILSILLQETKCILKTQPHFGKSGEDYHKEIETESTIFILDYSAMYLHQPNQNISFKTPCPHVKQCHCQSRLPLNYPSIYPISYATQPSDLLIVATFLKCDLML